MGLTLVLALVCVVKRFVCLCARASLRLARKRIATRCNIGGKKKLRSFAARVTFFLLFFGVRVVLLVVLG